MPVRPMPQAVHTARAPRAIGPYSQAVVCDGWIFVSGQIPVDPASGEVVGKAIPEQTARCLHNLRAILEAAGTSLEGVVKTTVYLTDLRDFAAMNAVYERQFGATPPARSTVEVARLPKDVRIEIDAIARV